jgi:hypothetical protein
MTLNWVVDKQVKPRKAKVDGLTIPTKNGASHGVLAEKCGTKWLIQSG